MAPNLRHNTLVKLVGPECEFITGARLPTTRQVLAAFYHQLRSAKLPIRSSARNVVKQLLCFWQKTNIPIIQEVHCISKVVSLHTELSAICKHTSRINSKAQINKEAIFCSKLDKLFDISKTMAIPVMQQNAQREKNPAIKQALHEDIQFLKDQKEGNRLGSIAGIDGSLASKKQKQLLTQQRKRDKQKLLEERRRKSGSQWTYANSVEFNSSSADSQGTSEQEDQHTSKGSSRRSRGTQNVVTPELTQALDAARVSTNSATVILAAAAKSFGIGLEKTNINCSTIHREREKNRFESAQQLMDNFDPDDILTVHWDGKIISSLTH